MDRPIRVVAIGAGSFVFSMGLLYDLIVKHRLNGTELILVDLDEEMATIMAGIARRMAAESHVDLAVLASSDRLAALPGANFVTTSVAAQLLKRYQMDKDILHKHGIREITSECGGLGGLSYALRQIPLIMAIARDMERLCPEAWLFNVSNPLPRVMTAVTRHTRIKAVGFCNVAWGAEDGYGNVGRLLGRNPQDLDVVSAGLNHFIWLLSVREKKSGRDLMPEVQAALEKRGTIDGPLTHKFWRDYGYLPLAGDSHTGEFLPFDATLSREHIAHHGSQDERATRRRELTEVADGARPWHGLMKGRSWERPGDVIAALSKGTALHLDMVNIPNRGAIEGLPPHVVVEVPAEVAGGGIRGVQLGPLPPPLADVCSKVSAIHTLAAEAAVTGNRSLLEEIIRTDPAITEKRASSLALAEMLNVHADLLPQFSSA